MLRNRISGFLLPVPLFAGRPRAEFALKADASSVPAKNGAAESKSDSSPRSTCWP